MNTQDQSPGKPRRSLISQWNHLKEQLTAYLFLLPSILIIGIFGLFPIGYAIYMSLFNWRVTKGGFLGFDNYDKIVGDWGGLLLFLLGIALLVAAYWLWTSAFRSSSRGVVVAKVIAAILLVAVGFLLAGGWGRLMAGGDKKFWTSMMITLFYAIGTVPTQIILAMVLAYLLFQNIRGKDVFRMIYFLPYITPVLSTAVVFRSIFSPRETALANTVLSWFGAGPLKWLFEPRPFSQILFGWNIEGFWAGPSLALVTIILFGVWTFVGYNTVIFLAGLGSISKEIYEAAEIDGANAWGVFRNVTVPLLSPVTFYLFLVSFIGTFKAFNHIFVMEVPSAQGTVATASVEIFSIFYRANNYGYAAAQAIVLFLVILGLTFAQNKLLGKKVFYG